MKKKKFNWPDFDTMSYKEEAAWWDKHDFTDFWDELKNVAVAVDLEKPKEKTLVLRIQKRVRDRLEKIAHAKGISMSSLARMWIMEKLHSSRI